MALSRIRCPGWSSGRWKPGAGWAYAALSPCCRKMNFLAGLTNVTIASRRASGVRPSSSRVSVRNLESELTNPSGCPAAGRLSTRSSHTRNCSASLPSPIIGLPVIIRVWPYEYSLSSLCCWPDAPKPLRIRMP